MVLRVVFDLYQWNYAIFYWHRSKGTLKSMWLHHKLHFVKPPVCGHTLYSLRIKHHYKSPANFMSCFIPNFYWSRSKRTLNTMWLHHKMHFVHPPGCGHTLYSLRIKHHYRSLANFMSCFIANFWWSRSKASKPCDCITRCTLYILQDLGTLCRVWE
jgi:hypothetical protein